MSEYRPSLIRGLLALTIRELKKWMKEPIILIMAILQPIIWMGLLGKAMNLNAIFSASNLNNLNIPDLRIPEYSITIPGALIKQKLLEILENVGANVMQNFFGVADYFSYMSVGMISMIVMFTTMFSGMSMVWDRRLGFLDKVLSTPVPRSAIIFSKVLNAALRSMFQATIILALAIVLGLKISPTFSPLNLLGIYAAIFLLSVGLSSLFLALALRSTRHEVQMAVVNLINMPLMFASNIFFPTAMMPEWLQIIANINPVSYLTDAIRQLAIFPLNISMLVIDFVYLSIFAVVLSTTGITLSWKYLTK